MEVKIAYLPDPVKVKSKPGYPPPAVRERLQKEGNYAFEQITTNELLSGALTSRGFTLLCLPGGFAPHYDDKLGDEGAAIIRNFVEAGGGFVGLCAGAYYGSEWGIELLPVEVMDIDHWARGKGSCKLSVTADGEKVLGTSGDLTVRYNNGPLLAILDASRATSLLTFESEFRGRKGTYPPIMKGSPAVVVGKCGRGVVALVSPHIEDAETAAGRAVFRRIFDVCSGRAMPLPDDEAQLCQPVADVETPRLPALRRNRSAGCDCDGFDLADCGLDTAETDPINGVPTTAEIHEVGPDDEHDEGIVEEDASEGAEARHEGVDGVAAADTAAAATSAAEVVTSATTLSGDVEGALTSLPFRVTTLPSDAPVLLSVLKTVGGRQTPTTRTASSKGGGKGTPAAAKGSVGSGGRQQALRASPPTFKGAPRSRPGTAATTDAKASSKGSRASRKTPYICHLSPTSQVLFTAPHGLRLIKGKGPKTCPRNHARERWSTEIALKLAVARGVWEREKAGAGGAGVGQALTPASFMVWDAMGANTFDVRNLDPNYVDRETARHSPWHSALHAFRAVGRSRPAAARSVVGGSGARLVHIDVHGKMDRADNLDVDVGLRPMEEEWSEAAAELLKSFVGPPMEAAVAGHYLVSRKSKRRLPLTIELDPVLSGYWGSPSDSPITLSHQSVLMGIAAFQLEIPFSIRELLASDAHAFGAFSCALFEAIDAALATDLGVPETLERGVLEPPPDEPLCDLEITTGVSDAWVLGIVKMLATIDTESVHGKQI